LQGQGEGEASGGSQEVKEQLEAKDQLAPELADAKRKFAAAAKRKQGEHTKKANPHPAFSKI
jgi:hypothetical protein